MASKAARRVEALLCIRRSEPLDASQNKMGGSLKYLDSNNRSTIQSESMSATVASTMGDIAALKFNAENGGAAAIRPLGEILKDLSEEAFVCGGLHGSLCIDIDTKQRLRSTPSGRPCGK